jgi:hypothetical protein
VVHNPRLRAPPAAPAALPAGGLKAATLALADSDREAADCTKIRKSVRVKVGHGRHRRTKTVTRVSTVCRGPGAEAKVQTAQAAAPDCAKAVHGKSRRARLTARRAAAACRAREAKLAAAEKASAKVAGGAYRIQVGAFDSKAAAQQHLTKLTKRYAVVAQAASEVQAARRGAYRARFSGFSAEGARSACAALAAEGERCMVLQPS